MRLTPKQKDIIRENAIKYFGENTHIWLFGSRVNDEDRGGDIDLYIEPSKKNTADIVMAKLQFLRKLHKHIGDQKVDVVLYRPGQSPDLAIYRIARQTGKWRSEKTSRFVSPFTWLPQPHPGYTSRC